MPKEAGLLTIIDPGSDKPLLEVASLQCVHCGCHWVPQPGSGKVRGFCTRCHGPVCGPGCAECVPTEQLLENLEAGRELHFRPTKVFIPRGIE
jgi:hypothetical protein